MSDDTDPKRSKLIVGVCGRAGTGKSTFARMLAEEGAALLDADAVAWELYARPLIRRKLKDAFGQDIFTEDGSVDRTRLGELVFSDHEALERLNAIMHPPLVRELTRRMAESPERVVIVDAALLLDWPLARRCDLLIALVARPTVSNARLLAKGLSPQRARAVLASQRPQDEFIKRCHLVVENNGTLEELRCKAGRVWRENVLPLLES